MNAFSRLGRQLASYWHQFRTVIAGEYRAIFFDPGVLLILVFALLIYSTLYSLAYGSGGAAQRAHRRGGRVAHVVQPHADRRVRCRTQHRRGPTNRRT